MHAYIMPHLGQEVAHQKVELVAIAYRFRVAWVWWQFVDDATTVAVKTRGQRRADLLDEGCDDVLFNHLTLFHLCTCDARVR